MDTVVTQAVQISQPWRLMQWVCGVVQVSKSRAKDQGELKYLRRGTERSPWLAVAAGPPVGWPGCNRDEHGHIL